MEHEELRDSRQGVDIMKILATALFGGIASLVSFMFFTHLELIKDVAVLKNKVDILEKNQQSIMDELRTMRRGATNAILR